MLPIKYLSLQKSELEYEVRIRGATPGSSVEELRKQIVKLTPEYPSETILESPLDPKIDLKGCNETITKVLTNIENPNHTESSLMRLQNMLNQVNNRLQRIDNTGPIVKDYDDLVKSHRILSQQLNNLQQTFSKPGTSNSEPIQPESGLTSAVQNLITLTCDRSSSDIHKLKYNGTTCVHTFIQKVNEFIEARQINPSKLLNYAYEIFQDQALHWYRRNKHKVTTWLELSTLLKKDFSNVDYDYKLFNEIRSRTQGEREPITIYLSIMDGLFSRLSKSLPESEQLEILLHNIRPCYANTIATTINQINSIETLESVCRNYEMVMQRFSNFSEPPKISTNTLAPDLAYNLDNKSRPFNSQQNKFVTVTNKIDAIQPPQTTNILAVTTAKKQYCFRCRTDTHDFKFCKAPRVIKCFGCGLKDVKRPNCPNCKKPALKND